MRTALTIAGSDPSGGAGIQADLKTFAAFGVYGASAITAITVQNTIGVEAIEPLSADVVTAQIEAIAGDVTLHATKVGMLATAAIVEAVAAAIESLELPLVVIDPVMVSSSGDRLLDADAVQAMCNELLPLARVVTPNIPEAEALSGIRIRSAQDARDAAKRIQEMGPRAVIITGGHAADTTHPPQATTLVIDHLLEHDDWHEFAVERIPAPPLHGTGCTFASAVAAGLALERTLQESARSAQQYVAEAIRAATAVGRGRVPLHHLWRLS